MLTSFVLFFATLLQVRKEHLKRIHIGKGLRVVSSVFPKFCRNDRWTCFKKYHKNRGGKMIPAAIHEPQTLPRGPISEGRHAISWSSTENLEAYSLWGKKNQNILFQTNGWRDDQLQNVAEELSHKHEGIPYSSLKENSFCSQLCWYWLNICFVGSTSREHLD